MISQDKKNLLQKLTHDLSSIKKITDEKSQDETAILDSEISSEKMEKLEEEVFSADAFFRIEISKDRMEALLHITPAYGKGRKITLLEITEKLKSMNVIYGVLDQIIKISLEKSENSEIIESAVIARGLKKIDGKPCRLVRKSDNDMKPSEEGKVDYHEFSRIDLVKAEDLFLEIILPEKGKDGLDITGKQIKAVQFPDPDFVFGENVVFQKTDISILVKARCGGVPSVKDRIIDIEPVLNIDSNVDFSTGNIEFTGDVVISGSILDDFRVESTGRIFVGGTINAAVVYGKGEIIVKKGILGRGRGAVISESGIRAEFTENAYLESAGNIEIKEASIQSRIFSGKSVLFTGRRATVIGGEICAADRVECKVIGSDFGVKTVVSAGVNFMEIKKMKALETKIEELLENLENLKESFSEIMELYRQDAQSFTKEEKDLFYSAGMKVKECQKQLSDLEQQKSEQLKKVSMNKECEIAVKDVLYQGTEISLGKYTWKFNSDYKKVRLKFDDLKKDLDIQPY